MAEALAIKGAKWVASTIVTGLLKEGFNYLGIGISAKLQELETTILPQFQFVIEAAERSSVHKNTFQSWLRRLKDAVYEAEDVLDLYKYQLLKEKVSNLNTRSALKPFKRVARKVNAKLSILSPHKIKLRISLNKLEKIAAEAKEFRQILQIPIGNDQPVTEILGNGGQPDVTISRPPPTVIGRDKERDEIIDKYLMDSSEASEPRKSYSVVAIVGIGGAGKTTLAQLIYNDPRVAKHFDVKMWVCVSRKLEVDKHTKHMVESSGKSGRPDVESREAIQRKLVELVKSNKILLVLDDVWFDRSTEETEKEWQTLVAPLDKSVKSGSKVLVTTRTKILPVALRPQYSMELKDLEENHILSLFKIHAFPSTELDGSRLQDELMTIGKQIVQKLHGSPLAARAVGSRLGNTLNVGAWKRALDGDNLRDSQQALLWSYQRLDAPLQRCFSYFSLFPKGHKYKAEEMVHLWIAEGFINSSNNSKRMEDIGMEYFDELVSASFLQKYREYNKEYYNMHDLFHDLAENVSKEDCLRIEDGDHVEEIEDCLAIRRLSIRGDLKKENNISINKLENLHTLTIEDGSLSSHAFANLLTATEKYKKLRVLMIKDGVSRGTLTKLMANLKHLRFLYFKWNEEGEIPAAVGKLYHLQVLCATTTTTYKNASLPRSLKNLINLRYFEGHDDEALTSLPDLGRLTSLQKLPNFIVKKEKGHDIGQLNNLKEIRGRLKISNLENAEGKDKAFEANLKAKKHLESLHLVWDSNDESEYKRDLDIEVLEGLQPHPNLINLAIEGYKSPRFPSWLLRVGCLQKLRSMTLAYCTALEVLPSLPQSLEDLEIRNYTISECPILEVKRLLPSSLQILILDHCNITDGALSPSLQGLTSLKSLKLYNISALTTLPAEEVLHHLIALTELEIHGCHWLKSLGGLYALPSLEKLEIKTSPCWELEMVTPLPLPSSLQILILDHCNITVGALSPSLQGLTSLKSFKLNNISALTTLPAEEVLHHLIALTKLEIYGCRRLKSLGGLYALPSLEELWINTCLSLRVYIRECTTMKRIVLIAGDGNPPNLATLWVEKCPSLASLSLSHQTALTSLSIKDCPRISSLPKHLPQSLRKLYRDNCSSISSLPEHLLQSLNSLRLENCPNISSLSEHLSQSLNSLYLLNCPSISSLPKHLPQSLEYISIQECQILKERCRSPNGEDWPKIAHIPDRDIDSR